MSQFVYPMQNILSMKEKLEDQAKNDYSQKAGRLREEELKLEECMQRQGLAEQELKQVIVENLEVEQVKKSENAVEIYKMYTKQQRLMVHEWENIVQEAKEILNQAMQERKIYEKLKEKAFEEFMLEENKKEQKEIDELVSYRFGQTRQVDA